MNTYIITPPQSPTRPAPAPRVSPDIIKADLVPPRAVYILVFDNLDLG